MGFFVGLGLFFIGLGAFLLNPSLDVRWQRFERGMRSRGIVNVERTPEWERSQIASGWVLVTFGVVFVLVPLLFVTAEHNVNNNAKSGITLNGQELTREEARRLGMPPTQ